MLKGLLLMSAAMVAAPALAQTAAVPPNEAQPAMPTQTPSATDPAQSSTPPTTAATPGATGETAAPAAAAPANSTDAVAKVIAADWSKYDKDNDGSLSKEEFAAWMIALRGQDPAQKAQTTDVQSWTNAAFAQADSDKSGTVTKPELERFLKG